MRKEKEIRAEMKRIREIVVTEDKPRLQQITMIQALSWVLEE